LQLLQKGRKENPVKYLKIVKQKKGGEGRTKEEEAN